MADALPELVLPDADAWSAWLADHHADPDGVWLALARKGTTTPTSLTYDQALVEALRHGWIDGQRVRRDGTTYRQRFTPRRARSLWSQRNVTIAEELIADGRMHAAGLREVERARADGRLAAAYPGQAGSELPPDLAAAIAMNPRAEATYETLTRQNRFALVYRVHTAKRPETRARRIEDLVALLARGDTPHPQRRVGEQPADS